MDRKEFLGLLGLSAGGAVAVSCLGSCTKESGASPSNVDFTLDLSDTAYTALTKNGGYLVKNGVIVAKTTTGAYIAVAAACTHEQTIVQYQGNNQRFYCPNHGATFAETGKVTGGPATRALKQYNTEFKNNTLRIFS